MKTIKQLLMLAVFTVSVTAFGANLKPENPIPANTAIRNLNQKVIVSVLNTEGANYTLRIYSEQGEMIFKAQLGSEITLGKIFDFSTSDRGYYTFVLRNSNGDTYKRRVKTGKY